MALRNYLSFWFGFEHFHDVHFLSTDIHPIIDWSLLYKIWSIKEHWRKVKFPALSHDEAAGGMSLEWIDTLRRKLNGVLPCWEFLHLKERKNSADYLSRDQIQSERRERKFNSLVEYDGKNEKHGPKFAYWHKGEWNLWNGNQLLSKDSLAKECMRS